MLLTAHKSPQLAVSAQTVCLLMVVCIGTAAGARLYSRCAHNYVHVTDTGTVAATPTRHDAASVLVPVGVGCCSLSLLLYAPHADMFLCLTRRRRLVARHMSRAAAHNASWCHWVEEFRGNGYNTYRLASSQRLYLGFNRRGRPLRPPVPGRPPSHPECYEFLQHDESFDIPRHNARLASLRGAAPRASFGAPPPARPPRRARHRHRARPR